MLSKIHHILPCNFSGTFQLKDLQGIVSHNTVKRHKSFKMFYEEYGIEIEILEK